MRTRLHVMRILLLTTLLSGLVVPGYAKAQPVERLTLAEALELIKATRDAASDAGLRLSIAVVDARGDLIASTRMDGARPTTIDTAIGKAMASAMRGQPSADLAAGANTAFSVALQESTGGRLRYFRGALPIVRSGYIVGAVGSSGASAQQDEDAVRAGLVAVGLD